VHHSSSLLGSVAVGAAAGAAGTTALNAATYLDMAVRGRPASTAPRREVERVAEKAGVPIPGDRVPGGGQKRGNRISGLGSLTGIVVGVGVGAGYGLARRLGWRPAAPVAGALLAGTAMAVTDTSMALLGVSDPRRWGAPDWLADLLPHLAYGLVAALVVEASEPPPPRRLLGRVPGLRAA
jgi:hypothetical protein